MGLTARKPLVLVVDDDAIVARAIARRLKPVFSVALAFDAETATTLMATHPSIAGAIVDACLSNVDPATGLAVLKTVRTTFPRIPIVLLTGYPDREIASTVYRRRADFLQKPYEPEDLDRFISDVFVCALGSFHSDVIDSMSRYAQTYSLTPAQSEVLSHAMAGLRQGAIAEKLKCSPKTIKRHIHDLLGRCGMAGRSLDRLVAEVYRLAADAGSATEPER